MRNPLGLALEARDVAAARECLAADALLYPPLPKLLSEDGNKSPRFCAL